MDNVSNADRTMILAAAMTNKADAIERLTPEQQAAYKEMVEGQKGTLLPLPALDRPLVDSTLTNPVPEQNRGTTLTTSGQHDQNGSSHTGNTGGNQTVAQAPNNTGNTEGQPAEIRNSEGRPVGAVINDVQQSRPADILLQEDGSWIVKGSGANIHVIDPNGEVVTSFKNSDKNTAQRLNDGRWSRPDSSQLYEFKNKLSDYADYKVEHQSGGFSTGGNIGGQFVGNLANTLLTGVNKEGHDSSTTRSAVSAGTITVRDTDKQQQDVANLSRDAEHASQTLSPVFDKEKEQKQTISVLGTLAAGLAGGVVGNGTADAVAGAQAGKLSAEHNFLSVQKAETLNKSIKDQKAGKNLLEASQNIVRLTNEDRASNVLLQQFQSGQPLTEGQKQELAGLLNQYGYELQSMYGYTPQQAADAVQSLVAGKAFVASTGDTKAYNEALSYLKGYSVQSGQAALGTDALLALPGAPGIIARSTLAAGGGYQAGTGIGQIVDGNHGEGALNIGLGTAAIFGGVAGNNVIGKIDEGQTTNVVINISDTKSVTASPLRFADHFDQLRDLPLLAGGELTDPAQRL
ncbi:hypothetical protein BBAD15_g10932 [Beauveria bassiana D1-5]|uniref:VENN motif-containing domain-containing protein n=1 Tax=Beauveria bassiana D1-5 TaxID=1245745 RepID=A0A0A2VBZ1_BEABA|nr:hypothetical protein BBAD15_g10932 [Beauveria bassiana D1-5]